MRLVLAALCGAALLLGCDSKSGSSSSSSSGGRVPAASITGPGVVRGKIIFKGTPPPEKIIQNTPCCEGAPPTLKDESVIVNADSTLANALVWLEGGAKADGKDLPKAELDQKFCRYVPHVLPVVVNQPVNIKSSDATIHNVRYTSLAGEKNVYMKAAGESLDTSFKNKETIKTVCDVHNWMSAYIVVIDTPLYSLTGESGTYEIKNIPAGAYKLVVWHERYGRMEQPVTVADGAIAMDFTYAPPQ